MNISSNTYMKIIWLVSLTLSVFARIPGLQGASYWWRAHQTELTAFWFVKEGIDLFNYQTPLYGPPWQIPFEFPLFQGTAALLSGLGIGNVSFACRLAAMFYFYLAALFLYLLCTQTFREKATTFFIVTLFLWLPYNIYYSTEPLIDYSALSFSLAFLFFAISWLGSSRQLIFLILAVISGSLAILVKITTFPVVLVPILAFVLKDIVLRYGGDTNRLFNPRFLCFKLWSQRGYWLSLLSLVIIPLSLGYLWTHHADQIKSVSVFTEWLTSKSLRGWTLGSWALRLDQFVWLEYIQMGRRWLAPYGLSIFIVLGFFVTIGIIEHKTSAFFDDSNIFFVSTGASVLLTFGLFLNLYQHLYYFIALSASLCIMAGYGIAILWRLRSKISRPYIYLIAVWVLFFVGFNIRDFRSLSIVLENETIKWNEAKTWAREVQRHIPEDEWVIIVDYDWSPTYPYILERKSMVYSPKDDGKPICKMARNDKFTFVVLANPNYMAYLDRVLSCYRSSAVEIMPGVYRINH